MYVKDADGNSLRFIAVTQMQCRSRLGKLVAIVVVGGSAKDIGKTALVCAIISALRDFDWTAVKITAHDYIADSVDQVSASVGQSCEETEAGSETDTSRYLAAGARRALLVTRSGAGDSDRGDSCGSSSGSQYDLRIEQDHR